MCGLGVGELGSVSIGNESISFRSGQSRSFLGTGIFAARRRRFDRSQQTAKLHRRHALQNGIYTGQPELRLIESRVNKRECACACAIMCEFVKVYARVCVCVKACVSKCVCESVCVRVCV